MSQISEQEFRDAIIATKKDAKFIAAAKNDRINSPESLYKEFVKLPVERQKEIVGLVSNDYFVGAQWKITFPLNNFSPANMADAVSATGKALFFSRDEDSVKEIIRALRLYQESAFFKTIASFLGDAAEIVRSDLGSVASILTHPEMYGLIRSLASSAPVSEKIILAIVKVATYTRDQDSTMNVAKFLHSRRHSQNVEAIAGLIENTIFMARDRKSVREILSGLGSGSVDRVLQRHADNKAVLSGIRDVAWKTRDSRVIRNYLEAL